MCLCVCPDVLVDYTCATKHRHTASNLMVPLPPALMGKCSLRRNIGDQPLWETAQCDGNGLVVAHLARCPLGY